MSLFSKVVSFAFLTSTLVTDSLEKSMGRSGKARRRGNSNKSNRRSVRARNLAPAAVGRR